MRIKAPNSNRRTCTLHQSSQEFFKKRGLYRKKCLHFEKYFYSESICILESLSPQWDFPGGPVVRNLPANAGDMGLIPGLGAKIPHAERQLSPCAPTTEPTCSRAFLPQLLKFTKLEPILCNKRSHCSEKPADCN